MHKLPLRERDNARVIDARKHNFKLSCVDMEKTLREEDIVYVKWNNEEIEKQYRLKCKKCNLWTFYKHQPESNIVFIVNKAMNIRPRNPLLAAKIANSGAGTSSSANKPTKSMSQTSGSTSGASRNEPGLNLRFATVTVSSMEEDEAETEAKEVANSYELNATIVKRELERQEELRRKRHRLDD